MLKRTLEPPIYHASVKLSCNIIYHFVDDKIG